MKMSSSRLSKCNCSLYNWNIPCKLKHILKFYTEGRKWTALKGRQLAGPACSFIHRELQVMHKLFCIGYTVHTKCCPTASRELLACMAPTLTWVLPNRGLSLFCLIFKTRDRLCGLVVRVLGYRSGGLDSIPGTTRKKVVGLERDPLRIVSTTEELLDRKIAAPV
jgi:hypothetical protein